MRNELLFKFTIYLALTDRGDGNQRDGNVVRDPSARRKLNKVVISSTWQYHHSLDKLLRILLLQVMNSNL